MIQVRFDFHTGLDHGRLLPLAVARVLLGLDLAQRRPHLRDVHDEALAQGDAPPLLELADLLLELVDAPVRALAEHADAALALHTHAAAVIDAEPFAHGGAHGGALGDLAGLLNPAADKPKPLSACEQNPSCDPANYARIEAIAERLIPR